MGTSRRYAHCHHSFTDNQTDSCQSPQINILVDHNHNARLADFGLVSAMSNATNATTKTGGSDGKGTVRSVL
jgi:hypothetical protein